MVIILNLEPSQKVYLAKSVIAGAGRGVFARQDIRAGEVIETCPVITVPLDDPSTKSAVLPNYFFHLGGRLAIALGLGSLYNHEYEPNATYVKTDVVEIVALRDIRAGEEVMVNYNGGRAGDRTTPHQQGIPPADTVVTGQ